MLARSQLFEIKAILIWAKGITEITTEDKIHDIILSNLKAINKEIDFMTARDRK